MQRGTSEKFLKEFPFLRRYGFFNEVVRKPKVVRIDESLLKEVPYTRSVSQDRSFSCFFVISRNGEELKRVRSNDFNEDFWRNRQNLLFNFLTNGEHVYEAIKKLENVDEVGYILGVKNLDITIYKLPQKKTLAELLCKTKSVIKEK